MRERHRGQTGPSQALKHSSLRHFPRNGWCRCTVVIFWTPLPTKENHVHSTPTVKRDPSTCTMYSSGSVPKSFSDMLVKLPHKACAPIAPNSFQCVHTIHERNFCTMCRITFKNSSRNVQTWTENLRDEPFTRGNCLPALPPPPQFRV